LRQSRSSLQNESAPETSGDASDLERRANSFDGSLIEKNAKDAADLDRFLKACGV
jgi:hypothetical protein